MSIQQLQVKIDESKSQPVKQRLRDVRIKDVRLRNQLKNNICLENGKSTALYAKPNVNSADLKGVTKSSTPPNNEVHLKESNEGLEGNNRGIGSVSGNRSFTAVAESGGANEDGDGRDMSCEPSFIDADPVALTDATDRPSSESKKWPALPEEDKELRRKIWKEKTPVTKRASTNGVESKEGEGITSIESSRLKVPPPEINQAGPSGLVPVTVKIRPRKSKIKTQDSKPTLKSSGSVPSSSQAHPHKQPVKTCYQISHDFRKQMDRRQKCLSPVQPNPPQGFKDCLMNKCTYTLAGNTSSSPQITPPTLLHPYLKDIFIEQEKERYRLRMQHATEREKLFLCIEQEILRVQGRAARALENQTKPFSACTILCDKEVYTTRTTSGLEEENKNEKYSGPKFLSSLLEVDDKWEKIKDETLLRHHSEAEHLCTNQKMAWDYKLKELGHKVEFAYSYVPMIYVPDDFDLLPE